MGDGDASAMPGMEHSGADDTPQPFGIHDLLVAQAVPSVFALSFGP